ncbi:MAG: hypothetical protein ABJB93_04405, partial [Gaiellales bacterium]
MAGTLLSGEPDPGSPAGAAEKNGFLVVLASPHDEFDRELAECVRRTRGGVLARLHRAVLAPAPVVAVMPRRDHDGHLGPAIWLGPLHDPGERSCVVVWLAAGGPAALP